MRLGARERARLTPLRALRGLDLSVYPKAVVLLARNPATLLGPLVASAVADTLRQSTTGLGASFAAQSSLWLTNLIVTGVQALGLAYALIGADSAWRSRGANVARTIEEVGRRFGDIVWAVLGFTFVVYLAGLIGGFLGTIGDLVLSVLAIFFFIYTLPAATIGGVPGAAALNVSLERAREYPAPTAIVVALFALKTLYLVDAAVGAILVALAPSLPPLGSALGVLAVQAIVDAIFTTYLAFAIAKVYADVSYGRRY